MALKDNERDEIARALAEIACQGGDALRAFRAQDCVRQMKADGSPVSEADIASEAVIRSALKNRFPDWPVVSEENAESHGVVSVDAFLLVDPLDGTRAFLGGGSDYCVLIAKIEKGEPVAGAIHQPASGRTWWAGARAFHTSARDFAQIAPLTPSPPRRNGRIATISSLHAEGASTGLCARFAITDIRRENSALKFARLAEGEADIYPRLGRTMQWDVAAGDALLRALGGGVFTLSGERLHYVAADGGWENPDFVALRRAEDRDLLTGPGRVSPAAKISPR